MQPDVDLLRAISADRALGSAILFPHRHPDESPAAHVEIIALWSCADPFVIIEAAREFGKTTLAEECVVMEGCFGNFNYLLLIGETYAKACKRLEAIDRECRQNERLLRVFGGKVLARKSIEDQIWFKSGAYIQALGWDQELQSFKYGTHRPDFCLLDDPENKERVRDVHAVEASMSKLYLELIPAMDVKRRRIRFSQTRRAEIGMVTELQANPGWLYGGFPICNGDPEDPATVSNWPARYPMEWIRNEYASFTKAGKRREFRQAYLLEASDLEAKPFKFEMLRALDVAPWQFMARYVIYDPSRTSNAVADRKGAKSDQYGKVVVSRFGSQIIVHESEGAYWQPDAFMADCFAANRKHRPVKMGIEKNSLDDWLLQPLRMQMLRRGEILPLKPLQAPQDRSKADFIMGLQPWAQARDIVLIGGRAAHPQLVAEWENFPQGQVNVLNALAYSIRMFAGAPVYEDFSPENVKEAPGVGRGETVWVGVNAGPNEVVAVCVVRAGRRFHVERDFSAAGSVSEAVKTVMFAVKTEFPLAQLQVWVPAETYDQWQRIPLVPALRTERLTPMRAEHCAMARGGLSTRMRETWHNQRMLLIDPKALLTLNALSAGYAIPAEPGKPLGREPEAGVSRLVAEALETMLMALDRQEDAADGFGAGANVARNPAGVEFVTSNPRLRA